MVLERKAGGAEEDGHCGVWVDQLGAVAQHRLAEGCREQSATCVPTMAAQGNQAEPLPLLPAHSSLCSPPSLCVPCSLLTSLHFWCPAGRAARRGAAGVCQQAGSAQRHERRRDHRQAGPALTAPAPLVRLGGREREVLAALPLLEVPGQHVGGRCRRALSCRPYPPFSGSLSAWIWLVRLKAAGSPERGSVLEFFLAPPPGLRLLDAPPVQPCAGTSSPAARHLGRVFTRAWTG